MRASKHNAVARYAVTALLLLCAAPAQTAAVDPALREALREGLAPVFVRFEAGAAPAHRDVRDLLDRRRLSYRVFTVGSTVFIPQADAGTVDALAGIPGVAAVEREPVYSIPAPVRVPQGAAEPSWNLERSGVVEIWKRSRGAGIVTAIIDSGVRFTHQALRTQYRGLTAEGVRHAGNWFDPAGACAGAPCDPTGHGTQVAAIAIGTSDGNAPIGVAPEAQWIACKACTTGGRCPASQLLACAEWVLDPYGDGSGRGRPDVVVNSWASDPGDPWFYAIVEKWREAGIFAVFAAGNTGPACETARSPGDYPNAFSVGATDMDDAVVGPSSRGPALFGGIKPDVAAPGYNIRSADARGDGLFDYYAGTSTAAPHVAGMVALLWSSRPELRGRVPETEWLLRKSARPLTGGPGCGTEDGAAPNYAYGFGLADAAAAAAAVPPAAGAPRLTVERTEVTAACAEPVAFQASAADPAAGDLSSAIEWMDNGVVFAAGPVARRSFPCPAARPRNVVARVRNAAGLTAAAVTRVELRAAPAAAVTRYTSEAAYLAAVQTAGYATVAEGFEDSNAWAASRSPLAAASVTAQGLVWTSNHASAVTRPGRLTTSGNGPNRSGQYAVYSTPHGNSDVTDPFGRTTDGLVIERSGGKMVAAGGWFQGMFGGRVAAVLDGNEAARVDLGPIEPGHRFYGVVSPDGFSRVEFRETEGKREDQKYVFGDDFTFALAGASGAAPAAVSAASYRRDSVVAPASIVSLFGSNLAGASADAVTLPLPTSLGGVEVRVRDSSGAEVLAPLFAVRTGQINLLIPEQTRAGTATLTVIRGGAAGASAQVTVRAAAPGIFTANSDGQGAPAAVLVVEQPGGARSEQLVFRCTAGAGTCSPAPVDIGPDDSQAVLVLYGTGLRAASLAGVSATAGGIPAQVLAVAPHSQFVGLDQVNLLLPRALAGKGRVELQLEALGQSTNAVVIDVR